MLIPGMNFTCSGTIISWRAAGTVSFTTNRNRRGEDIPQLQIWRETFRSGPSTYAKVGEIPFLTCNGISIEGPSSGPDLYDCILDDGIEVRSGDIIGLFLTRNNGQRDYFDLLFEISSVNPPPQLGYFHRMNEPPDELPLGSHVESVLPLIALTLENGNC